MLGLLGLARRGELRSAHLGRHVALGCALLHLLRLAHGLHPVLLLLLLLLLLAEHMLALRVRFENFGELDELLGRAGVGSETGLEFFVALG